MKKFIAVVISVVAQAWLFLNAKDTSTVVSGDGEYAVIENVGKNTYKRLPIVEEASDILRLKSPLSCQIYSYAVLISI